MTLEPFLLMYRVHARLQACKKKHNVGICELSLYPWGELERDIINLEDKKVVMKI